MLRQVAERMLPHEAEITTEWAEAWLAALPARNVDADAYRQLALFLIRRAVTHTNECLRSGELDRLYSHQYDESRQAARRQLGAGAPEVAGQHEVHLITRLGQPILARWAERLADDEAVATRIKLAQARLEIEMTQVISEAFSDEREAYLRGIRDRLQRSLADTERNATLGRALVQSLELDAIVDLALQTAQQLLDSDDVALMLANNDRSALELYRPLGGGDQRSDTSISMPIATTVVGWVFENNLPFRSNALPHPDLERRLRIFHKAGVKAVVAVPLRLHDTAIGTMGAVSTRDRQFSADDVAALQVVADYVAIAVENARAHAAVRTALADAENANRAKAEFIAAVSHELRSPLNASLGYLDLLADGSLGPLTSDQSQVIDRLRTVARSTYRLTNDLLEHTRIDAGHLPVYIQSVAVGRLIDEVADSTRISIGDKPIECTAFVADGVDTVQADPERLRQILVNLLNNAVKFTREGSVRIDASLDEKHDRVVISVRDTGLGIHPNDLPRVFDLFYRGEGSRKASGAGIGLFLSRRLATLMGGDLTAASTLGAGSCFTLEIPATPNPQ